MGSYPPGANFHRRKRVVSHVLPVAPLPAYPLILVRYGARSIRDAYQIEDHFPLNLAGNCRKFLGLISNNDYFGVRQHLFESFAKQKANMWNFLFDIFFVGTEKSGDGNVFVIDLYLKSS